MATYLRKLKRGDMRNKFPNIRVLRRPIYTCAKVRVYAGLANYVLYALTKVPLDSMAVHVFTGWN